MTENFRKFSSARFFINSFIYNGIFLSYNSFPGFFNLNNFVKFSLIGTKLASAFPKDLNLVRPTWLGLNPQIRRPLSRIFVPLVFFKSGPNRDNSVRKITKNSPKFCFFVVDCAG
jgi:hypothetical protein